MHHLLFAACALISTAPQAPPKIRIENRSSAPYSGWVYSTLPVARSYAADAAFLRGVTVIDPVTSSSLPTVVEPLKWHWDSGNRTSVALAKMRTRVDLAPNSRIELPVRFGANTQQPFAWHSEVAQWITGNDIGNDVFLLARFVGDPTVYVGRPPGQIRPMEHSNAVHVDRGRIGFARLDNESIAHPLSLTTYWTTQSGQAHGTVTFVVGNDTLTQPVPGGIQIAELLLVHRLPFLALPRARPTSAVAGPLITDGWVAWGLLGGLTLSDGQSHAVDFAFAVVRSPADPALASMQAAADSPLIGIADFDTWQASGAAGSFGFLPAPRFTDLNAARGILESQAVLPAAGPADDLGIVNRNPPRAGDQPDFMSGVPVWYQQAVQTGSVAPLMRPIVAAKRESWRPSNYWDDATGHWERASLTTYPQLFFWSGRPHYDASWNTQYPIWNTRAGSFVPGSDGGWTGMDNQHFGHNAVRGVYELTADPFLEDTLRANLSIAYWNFFTDWMGASEAERTGRIVKEAILLYSLFPDAPEAPTLRAAIGQKLIVFANAALGYFNLYSFPAIAAVRNDPRVILTQQYPNQDVHMSWQAGFNMEGLVLAKRVLGDAFADGLLHHYLDRANLLFLADGTPKTYTLMQNPTVYNTGGIGLGWWSGWVLADEAVPNNANHATIDQLLRPILRQALTPPLATTLWWSDDRWRSFQ